MLFQALQNYQAVNTGSYVLQYSVAILGMYCRWNFSPTENLFTDVFYYYSVHHDASYDEMQYTIKT